MLPISPITITHTMRTTLTGALATDPVVPERRRRRSRHTEGEPARRTAALHRRPMLARRAG
jgi:hypothetical protein